MPFVPHKLGEDGPKVPHLAVVTDGSGELLAIPPGAAVYIIEDQTDPSKLFPMILLKVNRRKLSFKCPCRDPNCSRVYEYTLTKGLGHHVNEKQRTEALAKNK